MKYFSEKLNKLFDDINSLQEAEVAFEEQQIKEKKCREEQKIAMNKVREAREAYEAAITEYIKKYKDIYFLFK